jgi:hypothetical protein
VSALVDGLGVAGNALALRALGIGPDDPLFVHLGA